MSPLALPPIGHPYVGAAPQLAWVQVDDSDFPGYGLTELFSLPAGAVILDLMVNITEAFGSSVTMVLGDGTTGDLFMDSTIFAPNATGTKGMKQDAQGGSGGGYHYAAADTLDITVAGATPTAGTAEIYLQYLVRDFMHN